MERHDRWTARFDAVSAECLVFTYAGGMLSALAHDLQLRVERFTVEIDGDTGVVAATLDAASLRVVGAVRAGVVAAEVLGARDRATIEDTIAREVLETARYPEIGFRAEAVPRAGTGDAGLRIDGRLSLHGQTRVVSLHGARHGERYTIETRLHQPDFGIRPYSAMLGTLRVDADVLVRVVIPLAR
jgi:polyisoprenoid-binding protein YceI